MKVSDYQIVIIGAGPVGLFAVFELGLLDMKCHLIDNLDKIGGQCSELYPEKPIYDIPSRVRISAQELVDDLMEQCKPFNPIFHLNQNAEKLEKNNNDGWIVRTNNNVEITCKCIIIAAGSGSFVPRKPPLENIENTTSIEMVMSNGRLYDAETLNEIGNREKEREPFWWENESSRNYGKMFINSKQCSS